LRETAGIDRIHLVDNVGLCRTCHHAQQIPHPRDAGVYWRCLLADSDPRFAKYPRLPVLECSGYGRDKKKEQE
jgi:hypothetical protein